MSQRVSLVGGTDVNPFTTLAAMGYRNLVPIVPPGADISPRSTLFTRVGTAQDGRGKTPGIKNRDGLWSGFDWLPYVSDDSDYARWNAMGAGCGIKTGRDGVVAIDADTMDETSAKIILDVVESVTGTAGTVPIRIGQHPKALYVFRCDEDLKYARVEFGAKPKGEHGEGKAERVEILAGGRQFVAWGLHPKTSAPYRWARKLVLIEDLPKLTGAQLEAIWAALRERLPAASSVIREGSGADVDQAALLGDLATVERAVNALPNADALFPSRESYRDVGYAIKAAGGDFDLWWSWCERWDGGVNDHGVAEADWSRMKPPFKRGASWLYEQAAEHSEGRFGLADAWFDDLGEAPRGETEREDDAARETAIAWLDPGDWHGVAPAAREWEVAGWIPRHEVTLLYGDGGIGKTLLIHQYATAAAAGVPWLGQATRPARVMCFFCEDDARELHRRQIDINKALGVEMTDLGGLRIASRKYGDNLLALWDRNTGAMKRQAIWEKLRADALAFGADVVVVDTLADTYGGSEIDRSQVNAFVKSCLGRLAAAIGGSVIALGHPSLAGKASGSGTSGSTAWSNAARSRLFLRYPKGVESGDVRELEGMKSNYGPKGALLKLRWQSGAFAMLASNMPGVSGRQNAAQKTAGGLGERLGYARGSVDAAALDAVGAALEFCAGVPMNMSPKSPRYAARVLRSRCSDMTGMLGDAEIVNALNRLDGSGHLQVSKLGLDASRKPIFGLRVSDELSESENDESDLFG